MVLGMVYRVSLMDSRMTALQISHDKLKQDIADTEKALSLKTGAIASKLQEKSVTEAAVDQITTKDVQNRIDALNNSIASLQMEIARLKAKEAIK
jgi:uncharacterized small protein (DUF1192 family)